MVVLVAKNHQNSKIDIYTFVPQIDHPVALWIDRDKAHAGKKPEHSL